MAEPLALLEQETDFELRHDFVPSVFSEYIGQKKLKEKLELYVKAALARQEPLDHVLLFGPPGLGKTTLAIIVAKTLGVGIKTCSGPMIERSGDLVALLTSMQSRDVFFIDEIHRMPTALEEILYSAMEQFRIDIILGQGAGAKSVSLPIAPFTLIGATTKAGLLSAPLRSRFGISEHVDFYTDEELCHIVQQSARFLGFNLAPEGAVLLAQCGRGTPRVVKKLVRRIRDFAQVHHNNEASVETVKEALTFLGIDPQTGFMAIDRAILRVLLERGRGGALGLDTIAALVGEDAQTIEDVYEPFLLRKGYLEKTSRGRQLVPSVVPFLAEYGGIQKTIFTHE
jgi:Holliday junction DNA helicase RuvB